MEGGKMIVKKLTPEERQLIEENRRKALEKRNQRIQESLRAPNFPLANLANDKLQVSSGFPSTIRSPPESSTNQHLKGSLDVLNSISANSTNNIKPSSSSFYNNLGNASLPDNNKKNSALLKSSNPVKASCVLISRQRFEVQCTYNQELIDNFKTLPTKNYDPVKKCWNFDLRDYKTLMSSNKCLKTAQIEGLPTYVTMAFSHQIKGDFKTIDVPEYDLDNLDKKLVSALMPFQRVGVCFGISKCGRVMIADDMGLGKTIQAICLACYYKKEWPLLVVTPSSVKYIWAEEFKRWVPSFRSSVSIHVVNKSKEPIPSTDILIINYDLLSKLEKDLKARNYQVIIMDESHFLKNNKSMRTLSAVPLLQKAKRVILLSGTPALNRPCELYTQIKVINKQLFKSFHDFALRYCDAKLNPWGWDYTGASNMAELQLILEECILIRRLKMDVINQLPAKQRRMVILDPSIIKSSRELKKAAKLMALNLQGQEKHGALLAYFAETGPVKTPAVIQYILDQLESCKKLILFAHHQKVLDEVCKSLEKNNHEYVRIDGRTSSESRKVLSDKFQCKDNCRAAILSLTAANVGITLTATNRVIFAELYWNPGTLIQAEDRAHRIGQQDCVIVDYLVAKDTADDYIWPIVQKKLDVLNKAGLSAEKFTDSSVIDLENSRQPLIEDFFRDFELDEFIDLNIESNETEEEEPASKKFKSSSSE